MKHTLAMLLGVGLLLSLAGCGNEPTGPDGASSAGPETAPAVVSAAEVAKKAPPPPPPPSAVEASKPHDPNEPPPGMIREQARVGSGAAGHYDQNAVAAPITMPIGVYFQARQRVAFQIEIPKAMQLYKGMEGHAPKTQAEFMQKIIKENSIQLPELPDGHRYVYDPAREELMVERPRN
jgi:hypothetical protein